MRVHKIHAILKLKKKLLVYLGSCFRLVNIGLPHSELRPYFLKDGASLVAQMVENSLAVQNHRVTKGGYFRGSIFFED